MYSTYLCFAIRQQSLVEETGYILYYIIPKKNHRSHSTNSNVNQSFQTTLPVKNVLNKIQTDSSTYVTSLSFTDTLMTHCSTGVNAVRIPRFPKLLSFPSKIITIISIKYNIEFIKQVFKCTGVRFGLGFNIYKNEINFDPSDQ